MEIVHNLNDTSVKRLAELYPVLAVRIHRMAAILWKETIEIQVTRGLATWNQQDRIYAQGRTVPGAPCHHDGMVRPVASCPQHPLGVPVTNAKGGWSWHNFACAVDVAPDRDPTKPGFQPDWDEEHPHWKRIVEIGEAQGLVSGKAWNDEPHFQLTGRFPKTPDGEVRQLFKDGGMKAVWAEIDKFLGVDPP